MKQQQKKRIRPGPGDLVRIDLGDGTSAYGRILPETIAFYDARTPPLLTTEEILSQPILFNIWVADNPIKKGQWPVIGHAPLEEHLRVEPLFFKKDSITKKLTIYQGSTMKEWPANKEECEKLECAAVWDAEHVVDRLRDHFAGRPNVWLESMRP